MDKVTQEQALAALERIREDAGDMFDLDDDGNQVIGVTAGMYADLGRLEVYIKQGTSTKPPEQPCEVCGGNGKNLAAQGRKGVRKLPRLQRHRQERRGVMRRLLCWLGWHDTSGTWWRGWHYHPKYAYCKHCGKVK